MSEVLQTEQTILEQRRALARDFEHAASVRFELDEKMAYGFGDSANNVLFGDIEGGKVSVKPFDSIGTRHRAEHENDMRSVAQERGFHTLPVGFVEEGMSAAYLVTSYVPNLSAMNQIGWEKPIDSDSYQHSHRPLLNQIGKFVGQLHTADIMHGDLQVKNVARRRDGAFVVIDMERSELMDGRSDEAKQADMLFDLMALSASIMQKNFLSDAEWPIVEEALLTELFEPYLASLPADKQDIGLNGVIAAIENAHFIHTPTKLIRN